MHELAIARSVLDIACRHADGRRVTKVEMRVGHLRQVVPSALTFAWDLLAQGTVLDGARLEIVEVPAAGVCRACGAKSVMHGFPFSCAACDGLDMTVTEGEELLVESLELEDQLEPAPAAPH